VVCACTVFYEISKPFTDKALEEIKTFQRTTDLLLQKVSFARLVRETIFMISKPPVGSETYRVQAAAMHTLQEACEAFLVTIMEEVYCLPYMASK
jgi:histone H3-like centromeric protein A